MPWAARHRPPRPYRFTGRRPRPLHNDPSPRRSTHDPGRINAAAAGDTVLVSCGTYHEHHVVLRSGVTLRSEGGNPACATIDAQGIDRVLIGDGLAFGTLIEGFTLTGSAFVLSPWAPVLCRGGEPSFARCIFADNLAPGLQVLW